jgi:serine/threonine protein kinase
VSLSQASKIMTMLKRETRREFSDFPSDATLPLPMILRGAEALLDLLRRILDPHPESRASVHEIMSHPWFKHVRY